MSKPFRFAELLARVRVRLRQAQETTGPAEDLLTVGAVSGSTCAPAAPRWPARRSTCPHASSGSPRSSCATPGMVLSREQLLDLVWGYDFDPGSNVVDVYVGYLRKKLGTSTISTVRGVGYRLDVRS